MADRNSYLASNLQEFLGICKVKEDTFRSKGSLIGINGLAYGGHLLSLAVKSALQTVPVSATSNSWSINSVHCNYIKPTRPDTVTYEVYNKRDGQIFSHRNVIARQDGKIVLTCSVSFKLPDNEAAHLPYNEDKKDPNLPGPNDTSQIKYNSEHFNMDLMVPFPFHFRSYPPGYWNTVPEGETTQQSTEVTAPNRPLLPKELYWMKPKQQLETEVQNEHRICLIAASDVFLPGIVLNQYPQFPYSLIVSLNHSVWFENDHVDINQWNLFNAKCLSSGSGTTLNISKIYREDGTLVATAVQQSYIRGPKL